MIAAWLALLLGCQGAPDGCAEPHAVLAEVGTERLSCAEAEPLLGWIGLLAARPIDRQVSLARSGLRAAFEADPAATRARLAELAAEGAAIRSREGLDGAAARSHALYRAQAGAGPIGPADGDLWAALEAATSIWHTHEGDQLALAEADIEAWIRYASLCREVQGAGALRISVADRVGVYAAVGERWQSGSRTERVALAAMGPYWDDAAARWRRASADEQQAWARIAPLPPPMTATSLGYLHAILEGDLIGHATALHGELGPLDMRAE